MRIAIVGYGKMGKEIEAQAKGSISRIIDHEDDLSLVAFEPDEVAIEFTTPDACLANINTLLEKEVPVVCGTTGWWNHLDQVRSKVESLQGTFLYASNFSVGVHLFWQTLADLSKRMNAFEQYQVQAKEVHHLHKKDAPSGTAKTCEQILTSNMPRLETIQTESLRKGEVVGDHHIFFNGPHDVLEISHKAKSRAGFAQGAISCAHFIADKKGFFTIEDFMRQMTQ